MGLFQINQPNITLYFFLNQLSSYWIGFHPRPGEKPSCLVQSSSAAFGTHRIPTGLVEALRSCSKALEGFLIL